MHGGATSAPPPTPSTQQSDKPMSTSAAADALSSMLHRLPPTLSLPTRRAQPATCPPVPVVSLSQARSNPSLFSSKLGFFQLTDHSIPPQLADSAESEALSLFDLSREKKEACFPRNWPVGFEEGDEVDDDDVDGLGESFCLDESCYTESAELSLASLSEFSRALEKVGLEVTELLCRSVGFESPLGKGDPSPTRVCSMMWVAEGLSGKSKTPVAGRFYPYVVGLQYQIRGGQKYSLLADSGWVSVVPLVESVLVTIGDIAQVWSNGELKKVRGRPVAGLGEGNNKSRCISMSLLVTLPIDTKISPVLPAAAISGGDHSHKDDDNDEDGNGRNVDELGDHQINDSSIVSTGENRETEGRLLKSFCLEDYAWRVYHERLHFKDPLDRFRIKN
ncbi:putative aminocyclopropanecarboxylate oxidase [Rosa chinensis]|uniref:Putative aminocyclopropanecarboxylate oxidase n=1 Tax=Rosa chinensis TaxID=74649 RepID=A0A2P6SLB9_ROSCH|nr:1-aminocyclopropane-1-carboxylate oxidase isoform X1 [Rosa chinensis]PRQ59460.1 putative aminocyclopropanecarboxylate oxidase [Rosa chinensis]